MKSSVGLSLCFFSAAGVQAFVGHAPVLQPRSPLLSHSSAARAAVPTTPAAVQGRRVGRLVTRMGWGDDVVFSQVRIGRRE